MQIHVNRDADVSLVSQIYQEIADRIRSGLLAEGTALPSIRSLSRKCGVSFMTVVQAYRLLEKEQLAVRLQGKGTFVGKRGGTLAAENAEQTEKSGSYFYQWQHTISDYLPRAQFWRQLQSVRTVSGISFSSTSLHTDLVPQNDVATIISRILSAEPAILYAYGPIQGDFALRQAFGRYGKNFGLELQPEEMMVTNGAQQAIDQVARSFIGPGDVVVTEAPTFSGAIDAFRARGATILPVPVDQEGMRIDLLTAICDKNPPKLIYTIPTFHNPTGTVMSMKRRRQLLDLAQSCRSLILEDDVWSELSFTAPPPPIKSMDRYGHVIYVKSFSKILAAGCRVAVLAAQGTILTRLTAAKAIADLGSPLLTQRIILSFLQSSLMEKHLRNVRERLRKRKGRVLALLEQHAPAGVSWTQPQGGVNIWLTLPSWLSADELLIPAGRENLDFLPGSVCYPGQPEANHLRISFSAASDAELEQGIPALCRMISERVAGRIGGLQPPVM